MFDQLKQDLKKPIEQRFEELIAELEAKDALLDEAFQIVENMQEFMTKAGIQTDLPKWLAKVRGEK